MRRMRPESSAIVRQVRAALLLAFAFSIGASVCALALPLIVVHAVTAVEAASAHIVVPHLLFALAALLLRGVFLTARGRVLTRTALWTNHAAGADVLSHGLDAVRSPNDLATDRERLLQIGTAIGRTGPIFDAFLVVLPLAVLLALHPVVGLVNTVTVLLAVGIIAFSLYRLDHDDRAAEARRLDAEGAWRTASASSVVIAARGMTARTVGDWLGLNGRAIAKSYQLAQGIERTDALLRHLIAVSTVAALAVLVVAAPQGVSIAVAVAALLLHVGSLATITNAWDLLPSTLAALRQCERLTAPSPSVLDSHPAASPHAGHARPAPDPRYAEVS